MSKIPAGKFDAARIAQELYDNDEIRGPYFAAAYERFQNCNSDPYDAAEYIKDRFWEDHSDRYSDTEWAAIDSHLYESIIAGLT